MKDKEFKGCWDCKHIRALGPETYYCELLDKKIEDGLHLSQCRLKDCPLADNLSFGDQEVILDTMPFRLVGKFKKNEVYYSGDIAIMDDNRYYVMLEGEWVLLREEAELEIDYSTLQLMEEYDAES